MVFPFHLSGSVEQTAARSLRLREGDFRRKLKSERQVSRHKEPDISKLLHTTTNN